ncbi:MAG: tRNA (N(6)-L-threonylcarbamoyladenosine(37)-C(2))-methylthiotransferase MtaB [Ktedonobacteraceae bacterium]|nr:tRNA (N(6)-L-threonylcarbamoyladenosine(37)-C(2))-methylthiotransferase MtaB [Ktedonobacteraceae bacterium]
MSNQRSQQTTFAVTTLGCKVNQADSEAISEQMSAAGFVQHDFNEAADIYIVNTCTVTHMGDRSSRQMIAQAHRRCPDALLVVTGCYAEMNPNAVAALPGVDLVLGNSAKNSLVEAILAQRQLSHESTGCAATVKDAQRVLHELPVLPLETQHIGSDGALDFQTLQPEPDNPSPCIDGANGTLPTPVAVIPNANAIPDAKQFSRTRVQMKVQDGCDNRCTYCIVPSVRGKSRSRSIASVVEHVQRKVRAGFQEVVLTGIHLGDYHPEADERRDLGDLIATLLGETGIARIRVSSLEPEDFRLEWLGLWRDPRMCRHLHLPMQSGSDAILRRMARRYDSARYHAIVAEAKRRVPGIAISTDIITGFPGESEEDFEQTYQLARELQFAKAHIFRFSPRQGTAAARMKGQVHEEIKRARSERLLVLNEEHSRLFRQQFLGETVQVLIEQFRHEHWEGLTDNYLRVVLSQLPECIGSWQHALVQARLTHLVDDGISGVYVE